MTRIAMIRRKSDATRSAGRLDHVPRKSQMQLIASRWTTRPRRRLGLAAARQSQSPREGIGNRPEDLSGHKVKGDWRYGFGSLLILALACRACSVLAAVNVLTYHNNN